MFLIKMLLPCKIELVTHFVICFLIGTRWLPRCEAQFFALRSVTFYIFYRLKLCKTLKFSRVCRIFLIFSVVLIILILYLLSVPDA